MYYIYARDPVCESKRRQVNRAYAKTNSVNPEYEKLFDELHELNMQIMARNYRASRGCHYCKTPYD